VLLLFVITACRTGEVPADEGAVATPENEVASPGPAESTAGSYAKQYPEPAVQDVYQRAVDACFFDRPQKLASDLGVTNDPGAIAREYSMRAEGGALRDAAYAGCLEGLSAPGAGEEKPFGR
jgi:hypothetical protein